ncbi:hypothetical protein SAMN02745166_04952 [Prosthecobacter debontii]|uniref:Uncharacterized protein n=1 Tax=Prosthecobacter debontii TaxID=48467 RepID=A0A1T4Z3R3_9BACT|nr:hypothetical protein [Prosthecobacter debontii]SKB08488.1 hypothetical protein SAMN02745166_04952 [Prosthecobacter debontii]
MKKFFEVFFGPNAWKTILGLAAILFVFSFVVVAVLAPAELAKTYGAGFAVALTVLLKRFEINTRRNRLLYSEQWHMRWGTHLPPQPHRLSAEKSNLQ